MTVTEAVVEDKEILETPPPNPPERTSAEQENFERWNDISKGELNSRIANLDFIIDPNGILDHYADLILPEGWDLATTSITGQTLGTITLSSNDQHKKKRLNRAIKTYVANHGLRLSQADTFIETLYHAKYKVLPLLSVVLSDKNLYDAYRAYRRSYSYDDYVAWIHKFGLHKCNFSLHLKTNDRVQLSEMLDRMVRADVILRKVRSTLRERRTKLTS